MLNQFLEAAIPEPVACCLVRLRSFSLGHYLLLKKFCPSYLESETHDFGDLVLSCLICSRTYQDAIDLLSGRSENLETMLSDWGAKVSTSEKFNFEQSSNLFSKYVSRSINFPVVKTESGGGDSKTDASLWPLITLVACMGKLGQEKNEALDQPLSLSRWLVAGYATLEGNVEIVDPKVLDERQAAADKFDAEFRAKGVA